MRPPAPSAGSSSRFHPGTSRHRPGTGCDGRRVSFDRRPLPTVDLDFAASPVLLVLSAGVAGAFAWWSYARSVPRPAGWRFGTLVALRSAALALVLFLLFEPVWTRVVRRGEGPLVALLVDTSESLTLGTGGPTPAERVRAALAGLPADAAVRPYTFDGSARPVSGALDPAALRFAGERTDIASALARIEADFAGRNLRAIVLVSDGRQTEGRDPAAVAERSRVPVYTAVAGDSLSGRDVRLARLVTNDVATVGTPFPIQAGVRATGFGGRQTALVVTEGGRTVGQSALALPADGGEATADVTVTPTAPGLRTFTVTAVPLPGEATTQNNRQSVTVRVTSDVRQVLVVAAGPSPDLAALRAVLDADRGVRTTVRTQRAPGAFYEGPLPAALGRFDLVVLAGYPGAAAANTDVQRLGAAIQSGLPALFLLGRQTSLARAASGFGSVLPALPGGTGGSLSEQDIAITAPDHPILAGLGVPAARLPALPPLAVTTARWTPQPGSQTLATAGGAPLLVVRQTTAVRTAALLGSGTWRWRTLPEGSTDLAPVYPALLSGLVRWTTAARDRRPVRVRADRALWGEREAVTFSGQVYTEALAPVADADVRITLRGPTGRTQTVAMRALGNGRYTADAGPQAPGATTFTAEATRSGARLGEDRGTFGVGRLSAERREPGADVATMRLIALRSGGAVVGLDTLGAFVRQLRSTLADRPLVRRDATPVLGLPALLALIVALLTAEWVLRKRSGMV